MGSAATRSRSTKTAPSPRSRGGDTYEIYINEGQWQAWHDDAPDQDMLTGSTPDELNRAIREDWSRRQGGQR